MGKIIELSIFFCLIYGMFGCLFIAACPHYIEDVININKMSLSRRIGILAFGGPVLHIMYIIVCFNNMFNIKRCEER